MNRVLLHIGFWLGYLFFCILIEYIWVTASLPDMPKSWIWRNVAIIPLGSSTPEILFSYFMMYVGLPRLMSRKGNQVLNILYVAVVFIAAVLIVRIIVHYLLGHVAYDQLLAEKNHLFDTSQIFRGIIFMGFASGVAVSIKSLRLQIAAREREKNLIREKLSTELRYLRHQLHPDFLFNTLNNIYALTRKKSDLAAGAVMKLSELLHFMLYESRNDRVTIRYELNFLQDYMALEKIRYSDRLKISFEESIRDPDKMIGSLLLLPLVENAFKHGASETRFDSFIRIRVQQEDEDFSFVIENSFEPSDRPGSDVSIGLPNIRRQLELLYSNHRLEVSQTNNIYSVNLYLKLDTYGKNQLHDRRG